MGDKREERGERREKVKGELTGVDDFLGVVWITDRSEVDGIRALVYYDSIGYGRDRSGESSEGDDGEEHIVGEFVVIESVNR